jgi:hypothetical protein
MTVSETPSCGVTYYCHPDDSRGVIYDRNIFIILATVDTVGILDILDILLIFLTL